MNADLHYLNLLQHIESFGDVVNTRNAIAKSSFDVPPISFCSAPLVTVRKTAWKMALREMEWFLSGEPDCPKELLPWWHSQLDSHGRYVAGYGQQLRKWDGYFDQVQYLICGLRGSPNSRRHILTTWNASQMATITAMNGNLNTPTTCHNTMTQFFLRYGKLSMKTYQRSADLLLGVPHNWIQSWALLLWICRQVGEHVVPGQMIWHFGDAHIYQEASHLETLSAILDAKPMLECRHWMVYSGVRGDPFRAADFEMRGTIPEPQVTTKPKLL